MQKRGSSRKKNDPTEGDPVTPSVDVPEMPTGKEQLGVEIGDSQTRYGRLLGGAANQYLLRVYVRFINETQQPVVVKSLLVTLDDTPLDPLLILGPSLPVLLTSKGQEQLRTDKVYSPPLTISANSISERYAFFLLAATFQHESRSLPCTATVTFSDHKSRTVKFVVNW
jgi:hypothetical protein